MNEMHDLELLVRTRTAVVLVDTTDIASLEQVCTRIATRVGRPLARWTLAAGLQSVQPPGAAQAALRQPADVLAHIASQSMPGVFVLLDLHRVLAEPPIVSLLRTIAANAEHVPHTLLVAGPEVDIPAELRGAAARFALKLPERAELIELIEAEAAEWGRRNQKRVQAKREILDALARNMLGLSRAEARRLARAAIYDDGVLDAADLPRIMDAKYALLDQGGVLSFELDTARMADVAGLAKLKSWLEQRRAVFSAATPPAGLDAPKGLLLLGVQGGGKSLAAKAVAGAWAVPLLRLDFASLYNKYYGETERNLREALRTAELMAPCVLWIDEIEKGLASEDDGGPGKRILGTLLTWMAERKERVFLVATANDISALPPELLRKGRFDEIFFVDLPSPEVRAEIFRIHLRKRGQALEGFDCDALALAAEGFSGAEIEQAVVSALYAAHAQQQPLATAHIDTEIKATRPLSVVMAENIAALRIWAAERTVSAD